MGQVFTGVRIKKKKDIKEMTEMTEMTKKMTEMTKDRNGKNDVGFLPPPVVPLLRVEGEYSITCDGIFIYKQF